MLKNDQIQYYKTVYLRVGFDEKKHGFLNPCEDVMDNNIYPKNDGKNNYKPVPFYPTNPYEIVATFAERELGVKGFIYPQSADSERMIVTLWKKVPVEKVDKSFYNQEK